MIASNECTISVVIPVRSDPVGLQHTLRSLMDQDCDAGQYEVIVVVNGPADDTYTVAKSMEQSNGTRVSVLRQETGGSYAARNTGIASARGSIICFVDADMSVPREYLRLIKRYFANADIQYLGCNVQLIAKRNSLATLFDRVFGFQVQAYLSRSRFAPTCCLAVRHDLFARVGLFDARLLSGGDCEFGRRVHEQGIAQHFGTLITLQHPARTTLMAMAKKMRRVARGVATLVHLYPARFDDLAESFRCTRKVRPSSPWGIRRHAQCRDIRLSWWNACRLAVVATVFRCVSYVNYHCEKRRLTTVAPHVARPQGVGADL